VIACRSLAAANHSLKTTAAQNHRRDMIKRISDRRLQASVTMRIIDTP
jgi:hypothetical protein